MPLVTLMPVNTSRREGFRLPAVRWAVFPNGGDGRKSNFRYPLSAVGFPPDTVILNAVKNLDEYR